MEYFLMYLFAVVDSVRDLLLLICFLMTIPLMIAGVCHIEVDNENARVFGQLLAKYAIIIFTVCATFRACLPDQKGIAMIYLVPKIAQSDVIKKDLPEVYDLAIQSLKEYLKSQIVANNKQ